MEVFTDKLVAKIPSSSDGIVKEIKYEIDDVCLVGHALLTIETEAGANAPDLDLPSNQPDQKQQEKVEASPAVENQQSHSFT